MSPAFPSRRRAEQFDALLRGAPTDAPTPELAALGVFAEELRSTAPVTPRPEFAASLRERLMAEAAVVLAEAPADDVTRRLTVGRADPGANRARTRRERRLGVAIAALSIVGAATGTAVASQGALPGDTLYPVKRLIESAHTSLTIGDDAKGTTLLGQAGDRLTEVQQLRSRAEATDPALLAQALDDFAAQATEASDLLLADYAQTGDPATITQLHDFTQQGIATLGGLAGTLPEVVNDALAAATQTLIEIDNAVTQACPACDLGGIIELPTSLINLVGETVQGVADMLSPQPIVPAPAPLQTAPATGTKGSGQQEASGSTSQPQGGGAAGSGTTPDGGAPATLPSSTPTSLGDGVSGVVGGVGDTLNGVGDAVGGTVGDTVGQVGDTVNDLGQGLGNTLNGVGDAVGGLLGGPSPSPTP